MALNQSDYLVSADASWKWRRWPHVARKPRLRFSATGLDDQNDFLVWFTAEGVGAPTWMEITVVETQTADPPRRWPRVGAGLNARVRRMRQQERLEIAALTRRLSLPEEQLALPPIPPPPTRADYGFLVTLDDQVIGSAGIGGRGTLNVTVYAKRKGRRVALSLHVHGGENLGDETWRWRRWSWDERELDVGQRVRIQSGKPERLDLGEVREVTCTFPQTRHEVRETLARLRRDLKGAAASARAAKARREARPPPHKYPRTPIRCD